MKKCAVFITSIALFATTAVFTSAGQPPVPGESPVSEPGIIPPAPVPGGIPGAAAATDAQDSTTITVSRTFTNEPGAITIIGTAANEQEKQAIGAKLQEAAPGRTVNNQLAVSGQGIVEPSGAEKPNGKSEDNDSDPKSQDDPDSPDQK
jgi:hypothetical protein